MKVAAQPNNLPGAQAMIRDLLEELRIAVNECCNDYWNKGHGQRVQQKYGIRPDCDIDCDEEPADQNNTAEDAAEE